MYRMDSPIAGSDVKGLLCPAILPCQTLNPRQLQNALGFPPYGAHMAMHEGETFCTFFKFLQHPFRLVF